MWKSIIGFLWRLLTGEAYSLWKEHKNNEIRNVQNDVAAMPDNAVADELRNHWTK